MDADERRRLELLEKQVAWLRRQVEEMRVEPWPDAPAEAEPAQSPPPAPAPAAPAQSPSPRPEPAPHADGRDLEQRIGTRWLAVAGILLFVVAAGLFLRLAIVNGWIGPTAQIVIGVLLGLGVWGFGIALDRVGRLGEFAHVLAGGGVAITAFAVFAAHHFERYQSVLGIGLAADTTLLALVAVGALADAVLRRAQAQAIIAATLGPVTALLALDLTAYSLLLSVLLAYALLGAAAWRRWPVAMVAAVLGSFLSVLVHALASDVAGPALAAAVALLAGATLVALRDRDATDAQADAGAAATVLAWVAAWLVGLRVLHLWDVDAAAWWTLGLGLAAGALAWLPGTRSALRWTWLGLAVAGLIGFVPFLPWSDAIAPVWALELVAVAALRTRRQPLASSIASAVLLALMTLRLWSHEALQVFQDDGVALHAGAMVLGVLAAGAAWFVERHRGGREAPLGHVHLAGAAATSLVLCAALLEGPAVSLSWGVLAVALVGVGFAVRRGDLRVAGLSAFALTLGRIVLFDLSGVDALWRVAAFAGVGVLLLLSSWLYVRWARSEAAAGADR